MEQYHKKTRVLKTFSDDVICYELIFIDKYIGYIAGKPGPLANILTILDAKTGNELKIIKESFNGRLHKLGDTNIIVSEIGI